MIQGALYAIGLGIVALNILIAWYAYKITARRWMTRSSVRLAP